MERLNKPVSDGGAPYLNWDFYTILQQNNLISYRSFLDHINDVKSGNSGIILKGMKVTYTEYLDADGKPYWVASYDFRDSLIYLDGEFLEPRPEYANYNEFILDSYTLGLWLIRYDLDPEQRINKVYDYFSDVTKQSYFDYVTEKPTSGNYIEITPGGSGAGSANNPIHFCSRYFNRVLRYHLADEGQVFMTTNKDFFTTLNNGVEGYGDMFGFKALNDVDSIGGRFLIGFSTSSESTSTPQDNPASSTSALVYNYKKLGNKGGINRAQVFTDNLPPHRHGVNTNTTGANNDMSHFHNVPFDRYIYRPVNGTNIDGYALGITVRIQPFRDQNPNYYLSEINQAANGKFSYKLIVPTSKTTLEIDSGGRTLRTSKNLQNHTHKTIAKLSTSATNTEADEHNNLPPFHTVLHYTKFNPYV